MKRRYKDSENTSKPFCCYDSEGRSRVDIISVNECQCQKCGVIYRMIKWKTKKIKIQLGLWSLWVAMFAGCCIGYTIYSLIF